MADVNGIVCFWFVLEYSNQFDHMIMWSIIITSFIVLSYIVTGAVVFAINEVIMIYVSMQ